MLTISHSAIATHSISLVPQELVLNLEWKTPMGAIVFVFSLVADKGGLAILVKDSMLNSLTEKIWGKKRSESVDSSPADKKKSSISLANLVKRRKNSSSGGSLKDMGITLDDPPPDTPKVLEAKKDSDKDSISLAEKWETYQNISFATVDENNKGPSKPGRFKFFKKKPDRYTDENGEELSNSKSKGKLRRKRLSSGMSQISSTSDLSFKDAQMEVPAVEPVERSVRFEVGSENLDFGSNYQTNTDTIADQVD